MNNSINKLENTLDDENLKENESADLKNQNILKKIAMNA